MALDRPDALLQVIYKQRRKKLRPPSIMVLLAFNPRSNVAFGYVQPSAKSLIIRGCVLQSLLRCQGVPIDEDTRAIVLADALEADSPFSSFYK